MAPRPENGSEHAQEGQFCQNNFQNKFDIWQDDRTIVEEVVPGSLAQGHVQYGDM